MVFWQLFVGGMICYHILHYICIVDCVQLRPLKSLSSIYYNSVTLVDYLRFPQVNFNVIHRFGYIVNTFIIKFCII